MKKASRKYSILTVLLLLLIVGGLGINFFNGQIVDEDQIKRGWPGGKHGFIASNLEKAAGDIEIQMGRLIFHISDCKRFPLNLENAYKPIEKAPNGCKALTPWHHKVITPWIDPWGRLYQVRYDKERMKLQMRSQGRKVDDPRDDIVRETNLFIHKDVYYTELEKCKKLSSEDKNCVFNRGWH